MSQSQDVPPPGDSPDGLLVERTLAGDRRAFDLLVIKYQRRIQRLISRLVRDSALVEDIAQETFLRAYRALHQYRGDAQFYTWLYRIAINTAKKFLLERRRDPLAMQLSQENDGESDETFRAASEPSSDETPDSVIAARQIAEAVEAGLASLPDDLRQAITLREIEGLSYEEIAALMNCPIGTVRSRIFRAREAISARLRPVLQQQSDKRW